MKRYRLPFLPVSLLFLVRGMANNMNDTLPAAVKRIMSMSDVQTSLVQFSSYGAYFCFALPAAIFIDAWRDRALARKMLGAGGGGHPALVVDRVPDEGVIPIKIRRKVSF